MDPIDALQQKIYEECREVLNVLADSASWEELISKNYLISDLFQHVSFLQILQQHKDSLTPKVASESSENQYLSQINFCENKSDTNEHFSQTNVDEIVPEDHSEKNSVAVASDEDLPTQNNSLCTDNESVETSESHDDEHYIKDDSDFSDEIIEEELIAESVINEESYERAVEAKEHTEEPSENKKDRKFRLANIKGLNKGIQSLFDEENIESQPAMGSVAKSNMPLAEMEAPRPRPDFKLDLNDRIAFIKHLFGGSQNELNQTVADLNSFNNLDDAKQYLSDIYYEKNWAKTDDYAQRLWSLVENKFL